MLKKNPKEKQKWFFRCLSIVGLAIVVILFVSLGREAFNRDKISSRVDDLARQAEALRQENNELQYKIENWNSTGELEASARTQLGLKRAGEQAFVIIRPEENQSTSTIESLVINNNDDLLALTKDNSRSVGGNFGKWWNYFFH